MIHHFARALFVRSKQAVQTAETAQAVARPVSAAQPVRPRPITPWTVPGSAGARTPAAPNGQNPAAVALVRPLPPANRVRISSDPSDARRTVISGRFAEVCAALDRLVREQEAAA